MKGSKEPNVNLIICDDDIPTTPALADSKVIRWRPPSEGWVGRPFEGWPEKVAPSRREGELKVLRWGHSLKVAFHFHHYTFAKRKTSKNFCGSNFEIWQHLFCENNFSCIGYHQGIISFFLFLMGQIQYHRSAAKCCFNVSQFQVMTKQTLICGRL